MKTEVECQLTMGGTELLYNRTPDTCKCVRVGEGRGWVGMGGEGWGGMITHTSSIFRHALLKIVHKLNIATFQ